MINNFDISTKYARDLFDIKNDKILEIEKEALENNIPIITREVLKYMLFIIQNNEYSNILEIGTAVGYSGVFLSKYAEMNNGSLTSIEIDEVRYNKAIDNFKKMEISLSNNKLILGDALNVLDTLDDKYDFIFIDASKGQYEKFFKKSYKILKKNGIIFIDNILFKGYVAEDIENTPKRYKTIVKRLKAFIELLEKEYNFVLLPFGDGIGLVKNKIRRDYE